MIPDLEAVLRGVPCLYCGHEWDDHELTGEVCLFTPDFAAMAAAVRAAGARDQIEWLCERDNVIHVRQRTGVLQPCPDCGDAMVPTSPNLREIAALRADLAQARGAIQAASDLLYDQCLGDTVPDHETWRALPAVRAALGEATP